MGLIGPIWLLLCPHDHRRYVPGIDCGVEKLGAGERGEVHQLVPDLFQFAADFFAGFHSQLNDLAHILLEDAEDGVAGLQVDFSLSEKIAAGEETESGEKK